MKMAVIPFGFTPLLFTSFRSLRSGYFTHGISFRVRVVAMDVNIVLVAPSDWPNPGRVTPGCAFA